MKPTWRSSVSLVTELGRMFIPSYGGPLLKSAVYGSSLSRPSLGSEGGGLVWESVGKADLLSDHFDSKQSREADDLRLICHPSCILTTFTFRSSEVRHLLLDLDPYAGTDRLALTHWVCFLKRTANVIDAI